MKNTIKINDKVIFTNSDIAKGMTGVVEQITDVGTYVICLDEPLYEFFYLLEAQKHEFNLVD